MKKFPKPLVKMLLICKAKHVCHNLSGKKYTSRKHPQISTSITVDSQDFKNPQKICLAIYDELRNSDFPVFDCKMIVDELIKLANKYSNRSTFVDDRYVLKLGIKIDVSHVYQQINKNDRMALKKVVHTKNCNVCEKDIFGGSSIVKMSCKHMFHFKCMKNWLDRNIGCPICTPNGES